MGLFKSKNAKTTVLKLGPTIKKKRMEIFYFDFGEPFLFAKLYKKNMLIKQNVISIEKGQIEQGKIINVDPIIEQLKQISKNKFSIDLILSTNKAFDSIISLPKISSSKIEQLKRKEMKNNFERYKDSYHLLEDEYNYNLGIIFIEHFISNNVINNWLEITKGANAKLSSITLLGNYLYNAINNKNEVDIPHFEDESLEEINIKNKRKKKNSKKKSDKLTNFALIYVHGSMATFVLSSMNQFSTSYSFEFNSIEEIIKRFLLVIGKHEVEFEKTKIKDILVDSNKPLDLEKYFKDQKVRYIHFKMFDKQENIIPIVNKTKEKRSKK